MSRSSVGRWASRVFLTVAVLGSTATTGWLAVGIVQSLRGNGSALWMVARASGFTAYLLMWALVMMGLLLSHPKAVRSARPHRLAQLRIHVALAVFTLVFTVLHIVVLATDPWALVGWRGALLPMAAGYRPAAVTLGVVAVWAGLVTGLTASLAGRLAGRIWWPIHKVAAVIFVLVWAHGYLAGTDSRVLTWFYLATGAVVVELALSRYLAKTPADRLEDLVVAEGAIPADPMGLAR